MLVKALRNFSGKVSMSKDEIKNVEDEVVVNDLLEAGYIVKVDVPEEIDLSGKTTKERKKK
jgi:hypothetical protein